MELAIIPNLDPEEIWGEGWRFNCYIHGNHSDGISGFLDALVEAVQILDRKTGHRRLFATGQEETGQPIISGWDRLKALCHKGLADPVLLMSLLREPGQQILRYIFHTFGPQGHIEALRRTFVHPEKEQEYVLCLYHHFGGSPWKGVLVGMDGGRSDREYALVL